MASEPQITLTNAHGTFTTTAYGLDQTITRHLPASVNDMRERLSELNPELDYSDIHYVSEGLVMLADAKDYPFPR